MPLFAKLSSKKHSGDVSEEKRSKGNNFNSSPAIPAKNSTSKVSPRNEEIVDVFPAADDATACSPCSGKASQNGGLCPPNNGRVSKSQEASPRTSFRSPTPPPPPDSVKTIKGGNPMSSHAPPPPQDAKLVFHCQLAHGSPTGLLYGFTNSRELYERAAECYEMPVDDILYCTLNTHKVDMNCLLGGQIGLDDFIFIHVKGQKKEVDVVKDESALGVTIADNGAGKAFVKRIKADSVVGRLGDIVRPGDHIERIDGDSMLSKKHFEVAKHLRDLPVGATFTLRLIEPLKAGYSFASPGSSVMSSSSFFKTTFTPASGMQTLRFKAKGAKAPVVVDSAPSSIIIDRINTVLESYLGIHDAELALTIWDLAKEPSNANNPVTFLTALRNSELAEFQIPDEVVFDLWAATRDSRFHATSRRSMAVQFDVANDDDEKTLTRPSSVVTKSAVGRLT